MAGTNVASQFSADIQNFIADEVLPLAQRQLVAFQFGDPLTLPKGMGTTYTATRYQRVPLPFAPLSEGVPPVGQSMTIQQVSAVVQQWGDKITVTDVGELTIKHPLVARAIKLAGDAISETLDRNTFNNLLAGTQVNTVNSRGSRAAIVVGDVMNVHELNRATGALLTLGARMFDGPTETDVKLKADSGGAKASNNPRTSPHYVAIAHPLVIQDMRENSTFILVSAYNDPNKLYGYEFGEWGGIRIVGSNLVPSFTGVAAITGTPGTGSGGLLATNNYFIKVTASDNQNQYESQVYQVSGSLAVTGPTGNISVVLPTLAGFTFSVYIGLTSSPTNLATSVAGPTSGPMTGQATQLAGGQTVIITGTGVAQTPPAAPATGVTIYPMFIFGTGAYGQVMLDDVKITKLFEPDKSDPLNQLRVIGWKVYYGTIILNQLFMMRIESTSAFNATFS